MTEPAIRYIARKIDDPRGGYGYDVEVDGVIVGHVYEEETDLVSVRWRASIGTGYATRQSRKAAVADAMANAKSAQVLEDYAALYAASDSAHAAIYRSAQEG